MAFTGNLFYYFLTNVIFSATEFCHQDSVLGPGFGLARCKVDASWGEWITEVWSFCLSPLWFTVSFFKLLFYLYERWWGNNYHTSVGSLLAWEFPSMQEGEAGTWLFCFQYLGQLTLVLSQTILRTESKATSASVSGGSSHTSSTWPPYVTHCRPRAAADHVSLGKLRDLELLAESSHGWSRTAGDVDRLAF